MQIVIDINGMLLSLARRYDTHFPIPTAFQQAATFMRWISDKGVKGPIPIMIGMFLSHFSEYDW